MTAATPMLFACGGVAWERFLRPWRTVAVWTLTGLLVMSGAMLAPLAAPLWLPSGREDVPKLLPVA